MMKFNSAYDKLKITFCPKFFTKLSIMIVTRAQTSSNQQVQKYNFALYLVLPLEISVFVRNVLLSSLKLPFPSTHWTMRLGSLGVYPLQDTVKMKCMVAGTPYCKDDND